MNIWLVKEEHVSPLHSLLGFSLCCLVTVLGKKTQYQPSPGVAGLGFQEGEKAGEDPGVGMGVSHKSF